MVKKRQVVLIHGGDSFASQKAFMKALKTWPVTIDSFKPWSDWKAGLPDQLGRGYEVLQPRMPNKQNCHYVEWKAWFERMFPFLHQGVILVGHSQGGIYLAKYLSENKFPKKIDALFLVAAPHNSTPEVGDFKFKKSLAGLSSQCPKIFLYHSKDDPVVPFAAAEFYAKELPQANLKVFKNRKHFNQPAFPELVADIRSIK